MTELPMTNYWIDVAVREIATTYPEGDLVVSSGISPSASYHVGHFREIMTADALTWGLKRVGRSVRHVHVVDNFDPLRKRYSFLPESYDQYVGWPVCLVPDPFGACRDEHGTYAEHFYREFEGYARQMGIVPDEVVRSYEDLYATGRIAGCIEAAVEHAPKIRQIFAEVARRQLPDDWLPLQLLSDEQSFTQLKFKSIDTAKKIIKGVKIVVKNVGNQAHEVEEEQELRYDQGRVKLNWRLDWPARWSVLGVKVEPISAQEHGAAGGSYETGVRFSREIFNYEPPIPGVRYGNIYMLGETKKMSSSLGNLITPAQALAIVPPEVLRYFVVRSRADRMIVWDSGQGLFNLLKEYSETQGIVEAGGVAEFGDAYRFAIATGDSKTISSVPFEHLVQVYQTARGDMERSLEILRRTGFAEAVAQERETIVREFAFVAGWLRDYAPEAVRFTVQEGLPKLELSELQITFLERLIDNVKGFTGDGQQMHDAIYDAATTAGIKPGEAFKTLYRLILDRETGPRAGWFLASLPNDWLLRRLRREA